jgi:hypothetical protein
MLLDRLEDAKARAVDVMHASEVAQRWEPAAHARMIVERVTPDALRNRAALLGFADSATQTINGLLQRNEIESAKAAFDLLLDELFQLSMEVNQVQAEAGLARAAINQDFAETQSELAKLNVLVTERARAAATADQAVRENALRASLSWLAGPLGKAIEEIVSLAQRGDLTESVLANAVRDLQRAQFDVARIQAASASLSQLNVCAAGLANVMQDLVNTIALALGHLKNARDDMTEPSHLELFCRTAILDLENLRRDAN